MRRLGMSAWIEMIQDEQASGDLLDALGEARTPAGSVDNVMRVHSLRPNTMRGHVRLYRSVLHDDANTMPMWLLEVVGSYVSFLNDCAYSFANHFANATHLIGDKDKAHRIHQAMRDDTLDQVFTGAELAMLQYARKLTLTPGEMSEDDVLEMRRNGVDDGQILEVNQVCAYFAYANRLLNGLGVSLAGDVVGYYSKADKP
jgi:uncharacterized peroxidase-related enzyme